MDQQGPGAGGEARICWLNTQAPDFESRLEKMLRRPVDCDAEVVRSVAEILDNVRHRRDQALLEYTRRFDLWDVQSAAELEVGPEHLLAAFNGLSTQQREALQLAAERVYRYHRHQGAASWSFTDETGTQLGQRVQPIEKVGLYVPGGQAAYPSSVLMNAIPAKVAGVPELVMVVPTPSGTRNAMVLAAAHVSGVDRVFTIGGAQAIAALAYGTESIPAVDKIVGPGNVYVAQAKRQVFGQVGIDMVAGPSELVVVCDGTVNPKWVAMDLFSQAEHDAMARVMLLTPSLNFASEVSRAIEELLPTMSRQSIIRASMAENGALIVVKDLEEAFAIVDRIAPEHLEILTHAPQEWGRRVRHAGAIFLGPWSSEALGDYCAGPSHVLPTNGTARFSSPLGVYDFQKRTSVIEVSKEGAQQLGRCAVVLAEGEGLSAHASSASLRIHL